MRRGWWLEWPGANGESSDVRLVRDSDQLEAVLDEIDLVAILDARIIEVDMWPAERSSGDPLLIQFLIGDAVRGCLLWHEDGESFAAVDPAVPVAEEDIGYVRVAGVGRMDPFCTRISPVTIRDALGAFLMVRQRPSRTLLWAVVPAD